MLLRKNRPAAVRKTIKMENEELVSGCTGRDCEFNAYYTKVVCLDGTRSCFYAKLAKANESEFHDKQLIEATEQITKILDSLKDEKGRRLSLLATDAGMMLAWVNHDETVKGDGSEPVRATDAPEKVLKALRIITN